MNKQTNKVNTGKRIMKKVRTGVWVACALFGTSLVQSGAPLVHAEEHQATEVVQTVEAETTKWVANTVAEVKQAIESSSEEGYTIKWGDTLWALAQATGTTVEELAELNNIENPDLIYAGDVIKLVGGATVDIDTPSGESADTTPVEDATEDVNAEDANEDANAEDANTEDANTEDANESVNEDANESVDEDADNSVDEAETPSANTPEEEVQTPDTDTANDNADEDVVEGEDDTPSAETPVETPETPVIEVPVETPETPVEEEPVETPEAPVETPETPVEEVPVETPETPVEEEPETPVETPETPVETPETPVEEEPVETPETPVEEEPVETPETPVEEEPETPVETPETPVEEEPETPVETPETPVEEPTEEVVAPEEEGESSEEVIDEEVVQEGSEGEPSVEVPADEAGGVIKDGEDTVEEEVEAPVETPETPVETPETPVETPETPGEDTETPVETPETPVETPVEEVYEVKKTTTTTDYTKTFDTVYVEDATLPAGESYVESEGIDMKYQVIGTTITYSDGTTSYDEQTVTLQQGQAKRVVIGTKVAEPQSEIRKVQRKVTTPIKHAVIERTNSSLAKGETKVVQAGVDGSRVVVYEDTFVDGELAETSVVSDNTTPAVAEIVEVGTAPVVTVKEESKVTSEAFTTEYVKNDNQYTDYKKVTQEGVAGERTTTYEVTYTDGVETSRKEIGSTVTKAPVKQIVEEGTKKITETKTEKSVSDVGFEVEYVENPNQYQDYQKVVQEGVAGKRTTTYEVTYTRGVETGRKVVSEEVTTQPKAKIIEVGTKEEVDDSGFSDMVKNALNATDEEKYQEMLENENWRLGTLTDEEVDALNDSLDMGAVNQMFGKLINDYRVENGVGTLEYMPAYQEGTQYVSKTLADYGTTRINGVAHILPDGKPTKSVFYDVDGYYGRGENLYYAKGALRPAFMSSERYLAEYSFDVWLNSEGHRLNMLRGSYDGYALGIHSANTDDGKVILVATLSLLLQP